MLMLYNENVNRSQWLTSVHPNLDSCGFSNRAPAATTNCSLTITG